MISGKLFFCKYKDILDKYAKRLTIVNQQSSIINLYEEVAMIIDKLAGLDPILQALLGTCFTWFVTALGASAVFFFTTISRKVLDGMLGFAAGVMTAASFWSLLAPAIDLSEEMGLTPWVPPLIGFLLGGGSLRLVDKILPHLHVGLPVSEAEGIHTSWRKSILLVLAITLHNFPEGLAVGVAFGAVAADIPSATLAGAVALAIGIGLQNFPEGLAVSVPLRREGLSRLKSFWYGQLSGVVEPIGGVLGAAAVLVMRPLLPYALAYAAGAMIFVVVEDAVPESQLSGNTDIATLGAMLGFAVMMTLDVALG
jgi:ZIP family zinc transporter